VAASRIEMPERQGPRGWVGVELPLGAAQRILGAVRRLVGSMGPMAARWHWVDPADWWIPLWVLPPGTLMDRAADAVRRFALERPLLPLSLGPWSCQKDGRVLIAATAEPTEEVRAFQEALGIALDRQGFEGEAVERPALVVAWADDPEGFLKEWEPPVEDGGSDASRVFTVQAVGLLSGDLPPAPATRVRTVEFRRDAGPRRPREGRSSRQPVSAEGVADQDPRAPGDGPRASADDGGDFP